MSRFPFVVFSVLLFHLAGNFCFGGNFQVVGPSFAQAPKAPPAAPPPPFSWQNIDLSKIDRPLCDRIKAASPPILCAEGDLGAACRFTKNSAEAQCAKLEEWSIWDYLPKGSKETFVQYAALIIFALFGLFATNLVGWIKSRQKSLEIEKTNAEVSQLENRVLDPFFARPVDYQQFATNLVLIGEGGSGKTTLLHALTAASEANPDISTSESSTYTLVHEISIETKGQIKRRLTRIYAEDYEGQNWVRGTQSETTRKRQEAINSSTLVIVVDLVAPGSKTEPPKRRESIDRARVREQLEAYGEQSIQTLTHLISPAKERQIVLFINKLDLIYPLTDATIAEAKRAYARLIERLEDVRGALFHVLVGSAVTGQGIVGYDEGQKSHKSLLKFVIDRSSEINIGEMKAERDASASTKTKG